MDVMPDIVGHTVHLADNGVTQLGHTVKATSMSNVSTSRIVPPIGTVPELALYKLLIIDSRQLSQIGNG